LLEKSLDRMVVQGLEASADLGQGQVLGLEAPDEPEARQVPLSVPGPGPQAGGGQQPLLDVVANRARRHSALLAQVI
jgi:hypothetical protein